jgi:hypothetical protein
MFYLLFSIILVNERKSLHFIRRQIAEKRFGNADKTSKFWCQVQFF